MDARNAKVATVTTVVIVILLLFSWQYIGQDGDGESPMVGEWNIAAVSTLTQSGGSADAPLYDDMGATEEVPSDMVVTQDGRILSLTSYAGTQRFVIVSDCEAISVERGKACQLYLHDGTLFYYEFQIVSSDSVAVLNLTITQLTYDGMYDVDQDVPVIGGESIDYGIEVFDEYGITGDKVMTVTYGDQEERGIEMFVDIDGSVVPALGFVKDDCVKGTVIDVVCINGGVLTFSSEDGHTVVTGLSSALEDAFYIVGDSDGCLDGDRVGIDGIHKVETIDDGTEVGEYRFYYIGGIVMVETSSVLMNVGVYSPTLHGDGVLLTNDFLVMVGMGDCFGITGIYR